MEIHICIPTLNRYDLLDKLIESLRHSIRLPDHLWVIDNGGKYFGSEHRLDFIDSFGIRHHYHKFGSNLGVAASWNWFIQNVPEIRIITNDDTEFYPDTIDRLLASYDPCAITYPAGIPSANSFSCFVFPDHIQECIGGFDEEISPNYAYLEDNDFHYRMRLHGGLELRGVPDCRINHAGSATLKSLDPEEKRQHHERYRYAMHQYIFKWGGAPGNEQYTIPYQDGR